MAAMRQTAPRGTRGGNAWCLWALACCLWLLCPPGQTANITITCGFFYEDNRGNRLPIRRAPAKLYDGWDVLQRPLGRETTTNDHGEATFTYDPWNVTEYRTVGAAVYCRSDAVHVQKLGPYGVGWHDYALSRELGKLTAENNGDYFEIVENDPDGAGRWDIRDQITIARQWWQQQTGWAPVYVNVHFPTPQGPLCPRSTYRPNFMCIEYVNADGWDHDAILHEYGHYLLHRLYGEDYNKLGSGEHGELCEKPELAFNEGFAHAFSALARGEDSYGDDDLEANFFRHRGADNCRSEWTVARILVDLCDGPNSRVLDPRGAEPAYGYRPKIERLPDICKRTGDDDSHQGIADLWNVLQEKPLSIIDLRNKWLRARTRDRDFDAIFFRCGVSDGVTESAPVLTSFDITNADGTPLQPEPYMGGRGGGVLRLCASPTDADQEDAQRLIVKYYYTTTDESGLLRPRSQWQCLGGAGPNNYELQWDTANFTTFVEGEPLTPTIGYWRTEFIGLGKTTPFSVQVIAIATDGMLESRPLTFCLMIDNRATTSGPAAPPTGPGEGEPGLGAALSYSCVAQWKIPAAPYHLAMDPQGCIFAVTTDCHIYRLSSGGQVEAVWGGTNLRAAVPLKQVKGICVDSHGDVWVTDHHAHQVAKFSRDGQLLLSWGKPGRLDGELSFPWGLAVDAAGNVYVADWGNWRLQKFTHDGQFIAKSAGEQRGLMDVAIAPDGTVHVARGACMLQFGPEGALLRQWGDYGEAEGQMFNVEALAIDREGNLYLSDVVNKRISVFSRAGRYLGCFSLPEWRQPGKRCPHGVCVDASGAVYVADEEYVVKFVPAG